MPTVPSSGRLRLRSDGDAQVLEVDGERVGRLDGDEVEVGGLSAAVEQVGTRRALVAGRDRVLRLDPGGRKATTLTLSDSRFRLARQKGLPGLRSWRLTSGVTGDEVLTVSKGFLGTSVELTDLDGLGERERELLVAGSLVVALGA